MLYNGRNNTELIYVILLTVNPDDKLRLIVKHSGGVLGLLPIASDNTTVFRMILQFLRCTERLQLLRMKGIGSMSLLLRAIITSIAWGPEIAEVIFNSSSEEERYILLQEDHNSPLDMPLW